MNYRRALPVISISFCILYVLCVNFHWELFVYYPATRQVHRFIDRTFGPPMFWYGWLASATLGSLLVGAVYLLISSREAKVKPVFLWVIPTISLMVLLYLNRIWFL